MSIQKKIYGTCFGYWKLSTGWLESNYSKELSFVDELLWSIMFRVSFVLSNETDSFMGDKEFCIRCKYTTLNNLRKTISRYLTIETQINEDERALLNQIQSGINDVCIDINEHYPKSDVEHQVIKNEMRDLIPHDDKVVLRGYFRSGHVEDEDEDDGDVLI